MSENYDEEAALEAALRLSVQTAKEDDKRRQQKYGLVTRTTLPPDETDRTARALKTQSAEVEARLAGYGGGKGKDHNAAPPRPAPPSSIARPRPTGTTKAMERQISVPVSAYTVQNTPTVQSPMDSELVANKLPPPLPTVGPNARSRQIGMTTAPSNSGIAAMQPTSTAPSPAAQQDKPLIALSPPVCPGFDNWFDFDLSALDPLKSQMASGQKPKAQPSSQQATHKQPFRPLELERKAVVGVSGQMQYISSPSGSTSGQGPSTTSMVPAQHMAATEMKVVLGGSVPMPVGGQRGGSQRPSTPVMGLPYSSGYSTATVAGSTANYMMSGVSQVNSTAIALPSMVGPGAVYGGSASNTRQTRNGSPINLTASLGHPVANGLPQSSNSTGHALVPYSSTSVGHPHLASNPNLSSVASQSSTISSPLDSIVPLVPTKSDPTSTANKPSSLAVASTSRSRSPVTPYYSQVSTGPIPSPGLEAGDLMDFSQDFEPAEECLSLASFDPLFAMDEAKPGGCKGENWSKAVVPVGATPENITGRPCDDSDVNTQDVSFELLDPFCESELTSALEVKRQKHVREKKEREKLLRKKDAEKKEMVTSEMPATSSTMSRSAELKLSRRNSYISKGQESTYEMLQDFHETADEEIHAFCKMVAELKQQCASSSQLPHHGFVTSPQLQHPPYRDMTVKLVVFTKISPEPVTFTCDLAVQVDHVIVQVLLSLADDMGSTSTDDYVIKVFSLSEYFINSTVLGSYEYVQQCIKLDEDIKLQLFRLADVPKSLLRTAEDDQQPVFVPKHRELDDGTRVTRDKLNILMECFYREVEKLRDQALQDGCKKVQCKSVVQAVKAICAVLSKIETIDIIRAVQKLQTVTIEKSLRPASPSNRDAFVLVTEEGDAVGSVVDAETKQLSEMDDLHSALEELTQSVKSLIELYCRTFHTDFRFESATNVVREKLSLTELSELLLVHVASMHRVPLKWRNTYEEYKVLCGLYHGGRRLCPEVWTTVRSSGAEASFQETLIWDEWIQFDSILVSSLPRETRLTFTLIGIKTVTSGSNSEAPKQKVNAPLGWVAVQLFTHTSHLVEGGQLLGLWLGENAMPTGTSQSNTEMMNSVLLQVNLPDYDYAIYFPEFAGRSSNPKQDLKSLHPDDQERLMDLLQKDAVTRLTPEEMEFLWEKRYYLMERPEALCKVMQSTPCWSYPALEEMYTLLKHWRRPRPIQAMQLLLPGFADTNLRNYGVECIEQFSNDELSDYLTQLIQALKFESYHTSNLACLLLKRSATSIRIAHQMYWFLKEAAEDVRYRKRYQLLFGALLSVVGQAVRNEFSKQEDLVKMLAAIAEKVKAAKDKEAVLQRELENMFDFLEQDSTQLPLNPSMEIMGVDTKSCSYFTSNTFPLKLVLRNVNPRAEPIYTMFKVGDDLRQDMLTMQLIRIMDKLWLREGLDLRMVTFRCQATGNKKGLVELVTDAETLRKIQVKHGHGLAGSFKDRPIAEWLQVQNPTELDYQKAVDNFVASCAGYCVATYVLGICDRHNDNIMIKNSGHMFHIDFGKFLGDSQMIGNFKRDRTAFVLTSDMAYVIKGGEKGSHKFQMFVDLCCQAFNILRRHSNLFLTLFSMMTRSGVPGVNHHAVKYVQHALLPDHTDTESIAFFTRLIEESLRSVFTQINFFFHNLAQMKFSGHAEGALLSFIPKTYSLQTDGRIKMVEVFGYQKRYNPEKYYIYIIRVDRENQRVPSFIFRRYSEFQELHHKLVLMYPLVRLPNLPQKVFIGRAHVKTVAEARKAEVEKFLRQLVNASDEVAECDLVYTFFHPMLRDEQDIDKTNLQKLKEPNCSASVSRSIQGQVKLSIFYKQDTFTVMVMHVKDLCGEAGETPDPYVKTYLLPDPLKYTKRKTKISKGTFHPTYNEVLLYRMPLGEVLQRALQVSVWNYNSLEENEFLGAALIPLSGLDLHQETIQWYPLENIHHVTLS